jgi:hypothetical protein
LLPLSIFALRNIVSLVEQELLTLLESTVG